MGVPRKNQSPEAGTCIASKRRQTSDLGIMVSLWIMLSSRFGPAAISITDHWRQPDEPSAVDYLSAVPLENDLPVSGTCPRNLHTVAPRLRRASRMAVIRLVTGRARTAPTSIRHIASRLKARDIGGTDECRARGTRAPIALTRCRVARPENVGDPRDCRRAGSPGCEAANDDGVRDGIAVNQTGSAPIIGPRRC